MTGTALKLTALALMFIDHIYQFIDGMPIFLTWVGRLSAPVFVFCTAWGFHYTHNRKKYLLNMYWWNIGMAVGDVILSVLVPNPRVYLLNNIFTMLLLMNIIITIIERFRSSEKKQAVRLLGLFILLQLISYVAVYLSLVWLPTSNIYLIAVSVFPSILFCEGGVAFVLFGVALYFAKESKLKLSIVCIAFALYELILSTGFTYEGLFLQNYQWMMIFALPLILCYNGKKGRGLKWLFYAFYPVHIYLLYLLGSLLK